MRKIILATAALVGLAGPALADMTLPAGDYSQASAWSTTETGPAAFNATVEQAPARGYSSHFTSGHAWRHHSLQR